MRWVPALLALLLASCGQEDAASVGARLFKARQVMLEKPELLGIYRDGDALVVVYTDQAKMDGLWIRYRCSPPAAGSPWFCERLGDPTKSVFLRE